MELETVVLEEKDEVSRRQVQEDVLQVEQEGKPETTFQIAPLEFKSDIKRKGMSLLHYLQNPHN